jgi:hypothetical protein
VGWPGSVAVRFEAFTTDKFSATLGAILLAEAEDGDLAICDSNHENDLTIRQEGCGEDSSCGRSRLVSQYRREIIHPSGNHFF